MTILKQSTSPDDPGIDPQTLILAALGWILDEESRAQRFLDLTGLDPDTLRAGLSDPAVLSAVVEFLGNHEPDLIRVSEALAVTPEQVIAAGREQRT
ncbi:DUF3572 domain-containing protein [Altererythrobacter ishigakiensis]|uniref:DUF3572 domain-containing protein n=1 Tax=Altererythrobacter ishigakiensis TaxID=476157 RepID=UPI0029AFCF6A|nr:DUF3572 domain-containing protein [Altererythrobacter ishigakiensis]